MKYWFGWYLLGLVAIIGLMYLFGSRIGQPASSIAAGVMGGAWGFGWSSALERRRRLHGELKKMGFAPWGSRAPRYNGRSEPCDMWTGPCSCGATHIEGE